MHHLLIDLSAPVVEIARLLVVTFMKWHPVWQHLLWLRPFTPPALHLCAEADHNVMVRLLISMIVKAIVTSASSTNCVSQCCCDFAVSRLQAHLITPPTPAIINRSSWWPYLPSDTSSSLHSPHCSQSRFNKSSTDALISWFFADVTIMTTTSLIQGLFTVSGF